jgi:predicted GH43/DUF377 family glycosyl hydrolase
MNVMEKTATSELARRYAKNPILRPASIKPSRADMHIECLLNPGAFQYQRKTWLLIRVAECPRQKEGSISVPIYNEEGEIEILHFDKRDADLDFSDPRVINYRGRDYLTTLSHLRLMCSDDGINFSEPEGYAPIFGSNELESYGIEDCRVTELHDIFNLTYTMVSANGVGVGLIQTRDWKHFDHRGMIFPPHNKDCAIFEDKIRDHYYALHRPSSPSLGGNYIWLAQSPDLLHWGNNKCLATTRSGLWDSARVGAGAAPIRTPKGWLAIYHGADANHRYCLGGLLLDIRDPSRVLARSYDPIMEPTEAYELEGFLGNVIFTNGHVVKGDNIHMYYGASDVVICAAELSIEKIMSTLVPTSRSSGNIL